MASKFHDGELDESQLKYVPHQDSALQLSNQKPDVKNDFFVQINHEPDVPIPNVMLLRNNGKSFDNHDGSDWSKDSSSWSDASSEVQLSNEQVSTKNPRKKADKTTP